jgi:DNA-binding LacI/PurR family transcriptional regulator
VIGQCGDGELEKLTTSRDYDLMNQRRERPTLGDVAKRAHVSKSAASLILRGLGRFDESTRERVQQAATELEYRPNAAARYLSTDHRMPMVGLVYHDLPSGPTPPQMFWTQTLNEFTHELLKHSIASVVLPNLDSLAIKSLPLEVILLITDDISDLDSDEIQNLDAPLVVGGIRVDSTLESKYPNVNAWIRADAHEFSEIALQHVYDQGARHPAVLLADVPMAWRRDFRVGAQGWFAANDVPDVVLETDDLRAATATALAQGCDALVVLGSDHRPDLDSVIAEIKEHGFSIPQDVMVVSLSHAGRAEYQDPPVTVVHRDTVRVGRDVAQMVIKGVSTGKFESITLAPFLTQRASTMRTTD